MDLEHRQAVKARAKAQALNGHPLVPLVNRVLQTLPGRLDSSSSNLAAVAEPLQLIHLQPC